MKPGRMGNCGTGRQVAFAMYAEVLAQALRCEALFPVTTPTVVCTNPCLGKLWSGYVGTTTGHYKGHCRRVRTGLLTIDPGPTGGLGPGVDAELNSRGRPLRTRKAGGGLRLLM